MGKHHHHHHSGTSSRSRSRSASKHKSHSKHRHHHKHRQSSSSSDSMGINLGRQEITQLMTQKQQVSSITTDSHIIPKQPADSADLLEPINNEEIEMMLGFQDFESTKNASHSSVEHCCKQAKPKRKFRQRIFKKLGVNRSLEPVNNIITE
jgi:hypothetical protein